MASSAGFIMMVSLLGRRSMGDKKERIEDAFCKAMEFARIKDVARQKESAERRKARQDRLFKKIKEKEKYK